jgi:hypothetical protein
VLDHSRALAQGDGSVRPAALSVLQLMQRRKYITSSIVMASQDTERALHFLRIHHLPLEDREGHEVASGAGGVTGHRRNALAVSLEG